MLLQTFNEKEKIAFSELAKHMIAVDGVFDDREIKMYKDLCDEMGIEHDNVYNIKNKNIKELIYTFSNKNMQIFAILELLSIAFVDENYAIQEQGLIAMLCEILDISNDKLEKMVGWAKNRIELGQKLINIINQ